MLDFAALKRNIKKDNSALLPVRIALLGDSSTQFLVQAIKGFGVEAGINFEIFEAGYDQLDQLIFNDSSELYEYNPDHIVVFKSSEKLFSQFYKSENSSRVNFASDHISWLTEACNSISKNASSEVIYLNFPMTLDLVYGNYSNKTETSFSYQLRKLNFELMKLSSGVKNLFICDLCAIQDQFGRNFLFDPKMYINADMVLSIDALPFVAKSITDIVSSLNGRFKKCLVLDLDNVMWGGVIGDDGIENIQIGELGIGKAFTEFQLWVKQLKDRGILLAVCSNNEEAIAKEPFEKHPDMILRLDDIAVFVANRESKVDNIKEIQSVLNIGFDTIVFVDDDPFERHLVRTYIPQVQVPDVPEDPAKYLEFFRGLNLFETSAVTKEDVQRTAQYQQELKRSSSQRNYTDQGDFLSGLDMVCTIEPFNKFNIPRVAQLSQRSNQFNLRTIRYTESELQGISDSTDFITLVYSLKDRFGDSGVVSVVILKRQDEKNLFIDTWLMSCRVLKRGMEYFVMNSMVKHALKNGFNAIIGEYIPTPKNNLVKDHYSMLGFKSNNAYWLLNTQGYSEKANYIRQK